MRPSCYEIMRLTEILLAQAKRRSGRDAAAPGAAAPQPQDAASPSVDLVAGPSVRHWAAGPAPPHQQALQQQNS